MSYIESMNEIKLSSIAAIAQNYALGKDNALIWHLPKDLKHFKSKTLGKPIIMGRKSYESLGKPLPKRPNLVVSRTFDKIPDMQPSDLFNDMESAIDVSGKASIKVAAVPENVPEGPFLYSNLADAIEAAKEMANKMGEDEIFITGGGQIYKETLPYTERLYLTILDREYDADVFFPKFDWDEWNIVEEIKNDAEPEKDYPSFTFYTLDRKAA
ncbi:MAG: dihydrofolate reductase [Alphaproteobacteria bacterium]|nr:dihydrofolate reductase [Alphaproteobacteria bacterium]